MNTLRCECGTKIDVSPGTKVTLTCFCGKTYIFNGGTKDKLPRLVRLVAVYRIPSDIGAGDTLERLLAKAGGRKFKHLMLLMRLPCGCDDRQAWLNKKWPY
jgi:hypothetical protein